jgi:hypothetical protein
VPVRPQISDFLRHAAPENASAAGRFQFATAEVEFQMPDTGNEICTAHLRLLLNAEKQGKNRG